MPFQIGWSLASKLIDARVKPGMTMRAAGKPMKFGIFDHIDDAGVPLGQLYADRLTIAEAYDRAGFYGYHVAEHHTTPLGAAASPALIFAALALPHQASSASARWSICCRSTIRCA